MTLEALGPEIWSVAEQLNLGGGIHLPARMTVVRLPTGGLWLHSPIAIDDALAAELAVLGPVAHLVAPNLFHHLYLRRAATRYPDARVHAAPGMKQKKATLPAHDELGDTSPAAWGDAFQQFVAPGCPRTNEVLFFHRPSRSVITTDYVFNVRAPRGFGTHVVLRMMGTHGRFAQSRLWPVLQRSRDARRTTAARLLAWDFDQLTMSHGDPIREGAKEALRAVLRGL